MMPETVVISGGGTGTVRVSGGGAVSVSGPSDSLRVTGKDDTVHVSGGGGSLRVSGGPDGVMTIPSNKIEVVSIGGPQGPPGPPGPQGPTAGIDHTWAFGDAPQIVYTAPQNQRLVQVVVSIRTPLNGVAPLLRLGEAGSGSPPSDVLDGSDTDPSVAGVYEIELDYPLASGEQLTFTITPSGSTTGAGVLTLFFV